MKRKSGTLSRGRLGQGGKDDFKKQHSWKTTDEYESDGCVTLQQPAKVPLEPKRLLDKFFDRKGTLRSGVSLSALLKMTDSLPTALSSTWPCLGIPHCTGMNMDVH
ncbi:MAG: hypothetical protein IJJ33_02075 [Victivallales bacterium]|nr:hypothetical protein [Victivallales bacterium]